MTERATHPRSTCVMQGCRRWSTRFPGEFDHWERLGGAWVPSALLARRAAARSLYDRLSAAWTRSEGLIWRRMKAAAIQRAAGL